MKIQKVPADHKKPIIFSVNETGDSTTEDGSASTSLPPGIFTGQGTGNCLYIA